ncbi:MAG: efflux RND transporter periplasmic adaptor subunit [Rickettsiales bacterium]|jgi:HlyD family secretion protein|nr:efflux RND transporter periplasmic adaptor subunit [Rickettsiales bacterium]
MRKYNFFGKNFNVREYDLFGRKIGIEVIVGTAVAFLLLVLCTKKFRNTRFNESNFDIEVASIGRIDKIIMVTGTINPIDVVKVGSQVNGVVEKMYADFNDVVKKGQRLAKLETYLIENKLKRCGSIVEQARSRLELAKINAKRNRDLYKGNHIAKSAVNDTDNALKIAEENLKIANLDYENTKIELEQAYIDSPVSGTITARLVDEGQTLVAASSAPTLFEIAKDLEQMQIEASIPESDIGMIKKDMPVTFTVDAYRNKVFSGVIQQIRLNSFSEQNVVVYNVIIRIRNEEKLLLPGMTALVSITIDSVEKATKIPNSVFRFKPGKEARHAMGLAELSQAEKDTIAKKIRTGEYAYIYVLRNSNKIEGILVEKGISDLSYTAIKSNNLKPGDRVISYYLQKKAKGGKK